MIERLVCGQVGGETHQFGGTRRRHSEELFKQAAEIEWISNTATLGS